VLGPACKSLLVSAHLSFFSDTERCLLPSAQVAVGASYLTVPNTSETHAGTWGIAYPCRLPHRPSWPGSVLPTNRVHRQCSCFVPIDTRTQRCICMNVTVQHIMPCHGQQACHAMQQLARSTVSNSLHTGRQPISLNNATANTMQYCTPMQPMPSYQVVLNNFLNGHIQTVPACRNARSTCCLWVTPTTPPSHVDPPPQLVLSCPMYSLTTSVSRTSLACCTVGYVHTDAHPLHSSHTSSAPQPTSTRPLFPHHPHSVIPSFHLNQV
jgi:hypothetical protein